MNDQRVPIRIPRLSTADAQRERSQAYRSPSASSNTSINLPFASARSNVYLSTARPGYIWRPRTQTQYQKSLNFGFNVASPGVKPVLLQRIEEHFQKANSSEYKKVGVRRLEIFQEGFEMFINAFGVYKPVLNRIKSEYQKLFDAYAKQLQYIPHMKSQLMTMKDDADAKIYSIAIQFRKEKQELEEKLTQFDKLREFNQEVILSLRNKVATLRESAEKLNEEREAECETKQTLSTALNRYKTMLEEAKAEKMETARALMSANEKACNSQMSYEAVLADLNEARHQLESSKIQTESEQSAKFAKELQRALSRATRLESEFHRVLALYEQAVGKRADVDRRVKHDPFCVRRIRTLLKSLLDIA